MTTTQTHVITVGRRQITCSCGTTWPAFWTPADVIVDHLHGNTTTN